MSYLINKLRQFAVLILCAAAFPALAQVSCNPVNPQFTLAFGQLDPFSTAAQTITTQFSVTCTRAGGNRYAKICLLIGDGSSAISGGNISPRNLKSGANNLGYQIFKDSYTTVWGTDFSSPTVTARDFPLYFTTTTGNSITTTITMYGRIGPTEAPNLTTAVPPGLYESSFVTGHTAIRVFTGTAPPTSACNSAGDSTTMNRIPFTVTATVPKKCVFQTGLITDLSLGTVTDPQIQPMQDGTTSFSVQCTYTTPYQIGLDDGLNSTGVMQRRMRMGTTSEYVAYKLYSDSNRTVEWGNTLNSTMKTNLTGTGNAVVHTVYGRATAGQSPAAGDYTDTVKVRILY